MTKEAEALRIAYEIHKASGWKFTAEEVGKTARRILDELSK